MHFSAAFSPQMMVCTTQEAWDGTSWEDLSHKMGIKLQLLHVKKYLLTGIDAYGGSGIPDTELALRNSIRLDLASA